MNKSVLNHNLPSLLEKEKIQAICKLSFLERIERLMTIIVITYEIKQSKKIFFNK